MRWSFLCACFTKLVSGWVKGQFQRDVSSSWARIILGEHYLESNFEGGDLLLEGPGMQEGLWARLLGRWGCLDLFCGLLDIKIQCKGFGTAVHFCGGEEASVWGRSY